MRLIRKAWKLRWKFVFPSDQFEPFGIIWGFPMAMLYLKVRTHNIRKYILVSS